MTIEDRLRRAIDARTSSVEPSDDGLERVTEKLLDQGGPTPVRFARNPWFLAAAAAVLVAALIGGFVVGRGDSTDEIGTANPDSTDAPTTTGRPPGTTTTAPSTTSTSTATTTSTTTPSTSTTAPRPSGVPTDVTDQAVWPRPSSDVRFDDPVAAANSFARYYVHFASPVVGTFAAGDSRSGEVPVRARANGPETTVLVRRLSDDNWYVVGAATADISVDRPAALATLRCPQPVSGRALAFEGTVQVRIDAYQPDGDRVTVGEGIVTGSGTPPAGPFQGSIPCTLPGGVESSGIVMFREIDESGDGTTALDATVQVVHLR
jgi:cytoskeletal protein RodZ